LSRVRVVSGGIFSHASIVSAVRRPGRRYGQHVHRIADGHRGDAHVGRELFPVKIPTNAQRFVALGHRAAHLHRVASVAGRLAERKRQYFRTDCKDVSKTISIYSFFPLTPKNRAERSDETFVSCRIIYGPL